MSVTCTGKLIGTHSTEITHGPSGKTLLTMAPLDNGGDGSSFSPTDLCAVSLASCAVTTMSMYAAKNSFEVQSIEFKVEKEMSATAPRRISVIKVEYYITTSCSDENFKRIVAAGKSCPVSHSLSPEVKMTENYTRV